MLTKICLSFLLNAFLERLCNFLKNHSVFFSAFFIQSQLTFIRGKDI